MEDWSIIDDRVDFLQIVRSYVTIVPSILWLCPYKKIEVYYLEYVKHVLTPVIFTMDSVFRSPWIDQRPSHSDAVDGQTEFCGNGGLDCSSIKQHALLYTLNNFPAVNVQTQNV